MKLRLFDYEKNEDKLKKILATLSRRYNGEVEVIERKARNSYIIFCNNKKYFLKLEPPKVNIFNTLSRFLIGGSIPFRNEIRVNKAIAKKRLPSFPILIESDSKNYLLFEYIEESNKNLNEISNIKLTDILISLQNINYYDDSNYLEKLIRYYLLNPTIKICRGIVKSKKLNTLFLKIRCLFLLLKLTIKSNKTYKSFFIHGDLDFNNLIITKDLNIYIIDFEDAVKEKKWIFIDVVDISFNREKIELNFEIINSYKERLIEKKHLVDENYMNNQLRYALLRRVMLIINSNKTSISDRNKYISFLENIVLNDKSFINWLSLLRK